VPEVQEESIIAANGGGLENRGANLNRLHVELLSSVRIVWMGEDTSYI